MEQTRIWYESPFAEWEIAPRSDFGEAEIENLPVAAFGDEDICGLDIAVNDAFGVGGV